MILYSMSAPSFWLYNTVVIFNITQRLHPEPKMNLKITNTYSM